MFGLGLWEIGVVVMLAVMLFPPKELPKLARTVARTYGSIRRTAEDFRSQILEDEDLRAPIDEVRSAYNDARWQLKKAEATARRELAKAEMEARRAASVAKKAEAIPPPEGGKPVVGKQATPAVTAGADYDKAHLDPRKDDEAGSKDDSPLEAFKEGDHADEQSRPARVPAKAPRAYMPPSPPVVPPPPVVAPPPALALPDVDNEGSDRSDPAESSVA